MPEEKLKISPQVSMKLSDLAEVVDSRVDGEPDNASRSHAIRVALARYESVCRRDIPTLSVAEWKLCCDALNGVWLNDYPDPSGDRLRFVWAEIADGIRLNQVDRKWEVDGAALVAKIQGFTQGQLVAFIDVVEGFWRDVGRREDPKVPGETAS